MATKEGQKLEPQRKDELTVTDFILKRDQREAKLKKAARKKELDE